MQNAKLKLILIAILIIAIVISALFLYPWLEQRKEKERQLALVKEDFQRCRNFENITMIDINPENPSVDITGMDTTIEYIIYAGKSLDCLTLHDIYFCNFITNEEEKRLCEEAYYSIKALKENNLDYCEKAGERKLLCQAILKKDETLCQEGEKQAGTSPFSKFEACKAAIKEDGEECESFQSEIKT
ncbi:hypothetical protein KJA17_00965, partial [Patescibacteria group bacterium]|nr:hypothetical protein [Patescibacteria group bacterium]